MELATNIFLILSYTVIGLYAAMILYAISGWKKIKKTEVIGSNESVSILVAARNESENIESIIRDLFNQDYPAQQFEVIVIDDHSEDDTLTKCQDLQTEFTELVVLQNTGEGKKQALTTGIGASRYNVIATTDADCRVGSDWLSAMVSNWKADTKMLLGPVVLSPATTLLERIQSMEMMAIMGLTGGFANHRKPIMANGANLFFSKSAFLEVGGYSNQSNPSGDDVFVMLKMNERWPASVAFVKDYRATVQTRPQPNFKDFWQQRKRWLSKKGGYENPWVKSTAIISFLANLIGLLAILFSITMAGTFSDKLLWVVLIKTIFDLAIIRTVRIDIDPVCGVGSIVLAELFILFYVPLLGLFGGVKNYTWKGRNIKVNE